MEDKFSAQGSDRRTAAFGLDAGIHQHDNEDT